jgi:predicted secreted hydrolase
MASLLAAPRGFAQGTPSQSRPISHAPSVTPFASVVPGYRIEFPRDEGSHPDFRIEWWYITGWLEAELRGAAQPLGFQITFFRARPELKHDNPSAFTPRQLLIAHAALSDPDHGRLLHAQRSAREGFELAGAQAGRTRVWIDDWRLQQNGTTYSTTIPAPEFSIELDFERTQPPLLQGQNGYSRKGPAPASASYYYSLPHLAARGLVRRRDREQRVTGLAWLDHEWSSQYMEKDAVGWDWIGINLDDGGALMAFRMRDRRGSTLWAGGSWRRADGRLRVLAPEEVRFTPGREWRSPQTGARYPVAWHVRAGGLDLAIEPLFDDQEHDTRASTGAIYWEGAARALIQGKVVGRGYLELTGYAKPLEL